MQLQKPAPVETEPLQRIDAPEPQAGQGEIRIRVKVCGVCHTDLHTVEGELEPPRLPLIPGHQIVGVIDQVGEGVTRFRPGNRAGMAWLHEACGRCEYCQTGRENLCINARFTGLQANGGYAQYVTGPAAFAYPLPEGYSDEEVAPLLCAGIVGYRSLKRACAIGRDIHEGGRLGLYGFGASAHIVLQVARHLGYEVYVFSRNPRHLEVARDLGAVWTGNSNEKPPAPLHSAIIFAPAGTLVPIALDALDRGGTLNLAGIYMTPIPELDYRHHLYYERTINSVANATRQDGEELLSLAREFHIQTITEAFPLEAANDVLLRMKESRIEASAVLQVS